MKSFNSDEVDGYAKLVELGSPSFIEVKVGIDNFAYPRVYDWVRFIKLFLVERFYLLFSARNCLTLLYSKL